MNLSISGMISKQRVLTALNHRQPDRVPCNYLGTPEVDEMLLAHFRTDSICFHGTISTQKTLPFGTAREVAAEVRKRIDTVGKNGGLILAPSHNVQPDTPLENILAMYEAIAGL